jgi:hypothetical protein
MNERAIDALSDDELVARIEDCAPLPDADDDDPAWLEDVTWARARFLLAAADEIGRRRLPRGIAPLFERAALGDAFEMMRGLRHGPERAVAPDYAALADIMRPLTRHERAGCRRWAVRELGILRDPRAREELRSALTDDEPLVRAEARDSLALLDDPLSPPRPGAAGE